MSNIVHFPTKVNRKSRVSHGLKAAVAKLEQADGRPLTVQISGNLAATVRQIAATHAKSHSDVVADWLRAFPPEGGVA